MFSWRGLFKNPSHLLESGEIHQGLMSAVEKEHWPIVLNYIQWNLKLPEPDTITQWSQLRVLLLALATQLVNLAKSSANPRNSLPAPLKESIAREVRAAFDALAQTCERLETAAQLGANPVHLQTELEQEAANLRQLLEATEEAGAEMARLTLSAGRWKVNDASSKFERLGWAARELTQFNRELDE